MNLNHKIGLGSVQFGTPYGISNLSGQTSVHEAGNILKYAANNNISFIDTASAYGNSEQVLGENNLDCFNIVSKFMPPIKGQTINDQLNKSLRNLGVNFLYGYLAHRPMDLLKNKNQWKELKRLKELNKIKKIGFSLNTTDELGLLLNAGMFPDLVQVPYNYFDNRFHDQLIDLKSDGCEVHTRSAFLQGLFFTDTKKLSSFFESAKQIIDDLQTKYSNNLSAVLLKYVLSFNFIDCVIIGVETKQQLVENLNNMTHAADISDLREKISPSILSPSNWPGN